MCVCVCVMDRQCWTAARPAYVVHLANNHNISLTVNNGPGRVDVSTRQHTLNTPIAKKNMFFTQIL